MLSIKCIHADFGLLLLIMEYIYVTVNKYGLQYDNDCGVGPTFYGKINEIMLYSYHQLHTSSEDEAIQNY